MTASTLELPRPPLAAPPRRGASDAELATAAGRGDRVAFEALYERHHAGILSFCRHMLGHPDDAEDVVQHTFLAADRAFRSGKMPAAVRAWLYTVARNRCISQLRARRDERALPDAGIPSTENLASDLERREDLRALLADLARLPDDQRAALLLAELGDLSHVEVADVIGVRAGKVKALVFQARTTLLAAADARATPCHAIREELAVSRGAALRRRHLRHHLGTCPGCSEFQAQVQRQRASLALILPVAPTFALRDSILPALGTGSAATAVAATATTAGGTGLGALVAKLLAVAAIGGAAAGGGSAVVGGLDGPERARPAERAAQASQGSTPAPAPAAVPVAPGAALPTVRRATGAAGSPSRGTAERADRRAPAATERALERPAAAEATRGSAAAAPQRAAGRPEPRTLPPSSRGRALGHAKPTPPRGAPPGRGTPAGRATERAAAAPKAPKPVRTQPAAPAKPKPASAAVPAAAPPAQARPAPTTGKPAAAGKPQPAAGG